MPDGDFISNAFPRDWQASVAVVRGKQSIEAFAVVTTKALSQVISKAGGIPGLPAAIDLMQSLEKGEITRVQAFDRALEFERSRRGLDLYLTPILQRLLHAEPFCAVGAKEMAGRVLEDVVAREFVARLRNTTVQEPFQSRAERTAYVDDCVRSLRPAFESFSVSLAQDPTAQALKTPKQFRMKRSTADLLDEVLA